MSTLTRRRLLALGGVGSAGLLASSSGATSIVPPGFFVGRGTVLEIQAGEVAHAGDIEREYRAVRFGEGARLRFDAGDRITLEAS